MAPHFNILAWRIPWTEKPDAHWGHKVSDTTEVSEHANILTHTSNTSYIESNNENFFLLLTRPYKI